MTDIPERNSAILIVDDNPSNVALLTAMLEDAGYVNIYGITDSRQVIPCVTEKQFDLILLDIRMPNIDGIAVLKLLANLGRDDFLPVLVLTAHNDPDTRKAALAAGARDFLTKPFVDREVMLRIRNTLETRAFYKAQRNRADALEEQVRERTKEIKDTQVEIIRRLGQAAEFRDNETGAHVMRMSYYCHVMALAAGQTEDEAEALRVAAPMHDIGKIGIPDHILLKQGKLTPDEFEIIKQHTVIGGRLLDHHPSKFMQMSREVAMAHHEKWDGSGYPNGLVGESIPINGRISAIADVFDALTSTRPYKTAWTIERAVSYIQEEAGRHFDPHLASIFLSSQSAILTIRDRFCDTQS